MPKRSLEMPNTQQSTNSNTKKRVMLLLDLDLTVMISHNEKNKLNCDGRVHPRHLSDTVYTKQWHQDPKSIQYFKIINEKKTTNLLEIACVEFDGVMPFTAGSWPPEIMELFNENLRLTDYTKEKLRRGPFHSALTDAQYFQQEGESLEDAIVRTAKIPKYERFIALLKRFPEYANLNFVYLDDNSEELSLMKESINKGDIKAKLICIEATTAESDVYSKAYFNKAINQMRRAATSLSDYPFSTMFFGEPEKAARENRFEDYEDQTERAIKKAKTPLELSPQ